jgi:hypothetical protein
MTAGPGAVNGATDRQRSTVLRYLREATARSPGVAHRGYLLKRERASRAVE